jgi:hypothetical protein
MDRKYGQHGYMHGDDGRGTDRGHDRDREKPRERPKGAPKGANRDVPRTVKMPGFQEVLRCSLCGMIVPPPIQIEFESQCPKCKADLRTCKNCRHFDTGAQFECTERIPVRMTKKDLRNSCDLFMARASIERETRDSGGNSNPAPRPANTSNVSSARSAFDNLFKK